MNTASEFAKLRRIEESLNRRLSSARQTIANANFLVLTDTPANYVGSAGKFVQVNGAPDGLQFALITAEDVQAGTFPLGEYIFQSVITGIDPTLPAHLATKEYVDLAINLHMDYFFTNTLHSIAGIYYEMHDHDEGEPEAPFTFAALPGGDDQPLVNFANVSGEPGIISMPAGVFSAHIHAQRTVGNRSFILYFELWKRTDPGGVETLLATSEISDEIVTKTEVNLHAAIGIETELDVTDILVVKWFANLGTGAPTTVVLYAEGSNVSHLTIPVQSSIFNAIYVRQDGSTELTGNWDAGAFDITAQNLPTKTSVPWNKSIGATGDYPTWATMIAAMPELIAHPVTVTIKIGTTLTEICELKNKHGITVDGTIRIQAERHYPTTGILVPTCDSATATTLRDAVLAAEGFGNDYFNDCWVFIIHGTGTDNGFVKITDYVDATGDLVVAAWPGTQPDNTSRYIIVGALIDGAGTRTQCLVVASNTVAVRFYGIGFTSANSNNIWITACSSTRFYYCGIYDADEHGLLIQYSGLLYMQNCGIVNNNTDNNADASGITINTTNFAQPRACALSDNNQRGIYITGNSFAAPRDNFGDGNGNWGTYCKLSGQAEMVGAECSGAAGNHSDSGTAGNNSADQAAAY